MDFLGLVWDWMVSHRDIIVIQTINGVVTGMILALIASGLTLIFGIMDVVNFAHGDLVMLGGFVGAATIAATGNFWLALLVAAVTIGVFGADRKSTRQNSSHFTESRMPSSA